MEEFNNIEIKKSKSGHQVPFIKGQNLHSEYNPVLESKIFIKNNLQKINSNNHFIIFGLGFGYHIQELIDHCRDKKIEVLVIEPEKELVECFVKMRRQTNFSSLIISKSIEDLYQDKYFLNFLLKKPAILVHNPSYLFHKDYFQKILKQRYEINSIEKSCFSTKTKEKIDQLDIKNEIIDFFKLIIED